MVTDADVKAIGEIQELLARPNDWTDEEIKQLRIRIKLLSVAGTAIRDIAQLRSNLEVILAVRSFDRASAELIETTNKLTKRIFFITVAAIFIGVVQVGIAFYN